MTKATIHLICGFMGFGKTTYAKKLAQREKAVRMTPDEWMRQIECIDKIFSGDSDGEIPCVFYNSSCRSPAWTGKAKRESVAPVVALAERAREYTGYIKENRYRYGTERNTIDTDGSVSAVHDGEVKYYSIYIFEKDQTFYYLSDLKSVATGDEVSVPFGPENIEMTGRVEAIEVFKENELPIPISKMKYIIARLSSNDK